MTGFVVEITSVELVNGGSAYKIPVEIAVTRSQSGWLIIDYAEQR